MSDLLWAEWWAQAHPAEPEAADAPADDTPLPAREKCTAKSKRSGERCKSWPVPGATVCATHGGSAPQVREKGLQRLQEQQALALARKSAGDLDLTQFGDPFTALETALGHQHALALRLLALVEQIPDDQLRYPGKLSEQLRGEVTAAQRALADLRASAEGAMRLGLAERRIGVQQATVALLDKALNTTLEKAGLGFGQIDEARQVFREQLGKMVIQGKAEDGS